MAEKVGTEAERLGRAVQVRRAELDLKRPELAKLADLSYPYVSEIENGMKTPSTKALSQLAHALQLSPSELMARAENPEGRGGPAWQSVPYGAGEAAPRGLDHQVGRELLGRPDSDDIPGLALAAVPRGAPAFEGGPDRRLADLVTAIVRAEIGAWARTELPTLVRAEVERLNAERDR